MATIINNPGAETRDGSGVGTIIAVVIAILLLIAFFAYGLPALRNNTSNSGSTVNVPDKVQVDINSGGTPAGNQ